MATDSGKAVGIVKVVIGDVRITGVDGVERVAQVGDRVLGNEVITTGANAVIQVELEGGTMLDLGRDSRIALDAELLSEGGGAPAAAQDLAALQAAIAAGADPSQVAAATAAGAPGAGG